MKNSKLRRALMLAACAVLLVCLSVGATLAYLTSSQTVTNTFTVGDVEIILNEAPVGDNGKKTDGARVQANEYHLLPGGTYDKDPMVTVLADSEECYVRMLVTAPVAALKATFPQAKYSDYYGEDGTFLLQVLVEGWNGNVWKFEKVDGDEYEFRYFETVKKANADQPLAPLFTQVVVPGAVSDELLASLDKTQIVIVAQAIQAANFDDEDAAWEAWHQ